MRLGKSKKTIRAQQKYGGGYRVHKPNGKNLEKVCDIGRRCINPKSCLSENLYDYTNFIYDLDRGNL